MPGGAELSEKLPDELFQLVESFKKFIREQKAYRDQKFDLEPILEVDKDADEFMLAFQRVAIDSDINSRLIQQIKDDTTKLLRQAELAYSMLRSHQQQQPQQTQQQQQQSLNQQNFLQQQPPQQPQQQQNGTTFTTNNQTTNPNDSFTQTTCHHFSDLADQFEIRMRAYGEQIKELKTSLDSIVRTHNADELFKWLKKQHETLGEIAAKVYMTHERIMEANARKSSPMT